MPGDGHTGSLVDQGASRQRVIGLAARIDTASWRVHTHHNGLIILDRQRCFEIGDAGNGDRRMRPGQPGI
jgi:hypothetical protein